MKNKGEQRKGTDVLPYPDSDMPVQLQRTIYNKIQRDEDTKVDATTFRRTLDRAIFLEKPDQES